MVPEAIMQSDSVTGVVSQTATAITDLNSDAIGEAAAAGGFLFGGMLIFSLIAGVIALAFLVWWIVLLIDLSSRDFPQKNTWLLLMILGLFLGFHWLICIIYYFSVVKSNIGKKAVKAQETK